MNGDKRNKEHMNMTKCATKRMVVFLTASNAYSNSLNLLHHSQHFKHNKTMRALRRVITVLFTVRLKSVSNLEATK